MAYSTQGESSRQKTVAFAGLDKDKEVDDMVDHLMTELDKADQDDNEEQEERIPISDKAPEQNTNPADNTPKQVTKLSQNSIFNVLKELKKPAKPFRPNGPKARYRKRKQPSSTSINDQSVGEQE